MIMFLYLLTVALCLDNETFDNNWIEVMAWIERLKINGDFPNIVPSIEVILNIDDKICSKRGLKNTQPHESFLTWPDFLLLAKELRNIREALITKSVKDGRAYKAIQSFYVHLLIKMNPIEKYRKENVEKGEEWRHIHGIETDEDVVVKRDFYNASIIGCSVLMAYMRMSFGHLYSQEEFQEHLKKHLGEYKKLLELEVIGLPTQNQRSQ